MIFKRTISIPFVMLAVLLLVLSSCAKDDLNEPEGEHGRCGTFNPTSDVNDKSVDDESNLVFDDGIADDNDDEEDGDGIADDNDDEEDDDNIADDNDDEEDNEDIADDNDDEEDDEESTTRSSHMQSPR